ncbi:hypothetical protein ACQR3P_29470 [Rhodococcus sp. IEGM1300]
MDIIAYGAASQEKRRAKELADSLGPNVQGTKENLKERLDVLMDSMDDVTRLADKVIVRDAVNLMKAEARLNTIVQAKKYGMEHMVFDDLLDLSGIDTVKSTGYVHDGTLGKISNGEVFTKGIAYESISKVLIVREIEESLDMSGPEVKEEVPLEVNPNWSRIGRQGTTGVIVPGQSFVLQQQTSLKSIDVYLAYGGGDPGSIKLSLQKGVGVPGTSPVIAESSIPAIRDTNMQKYTFFFDNVLLEKEQTYLFYFTTTLGSAASIENYKLFLNMSFPKKTGFDYYLSTGSAAWTKGTGQLIFQLKRNLSIGEKVEQISVDGGKTWSAITEDGQIVDVSGLNQGEVQKKEIILRFNLSNWNTIKNYGLIWT